MSNPIPSQLALTAIQNGTLADASIVQNNDAQIQAAVNAIITALSGGIVGQVLQAVDGSNVTYAYSGVLSETSILSGTVSYTAPTGATKLQSEAIGGGAAGGGCAATSVSQTSGGGGGGGGAFAYKLLTANIGTHTVAVGIGATGASGGGGSGGDTGLNDSVGTSVCVARSGLGGGLGAINVTTQGGSGGAQTLSIGDVTLGGGPGGASGFISTSGVGSFGGDAARGGGGATGLATSTGTAGGNGQFPGGGGGGAANTQSQAAHNGGNGANGLLFIRALGK